MTPDEATELARLTQAVEDLKDNLNGDISELKTTSEHIRNEVGQISTRVALIEANQDRCPVIQDPGAFQVQSASSSPAATVGGTTGTIRALGLPNTWTTRAILGATGGLSAGTLIAFGVIFWLLWKAGIIKFASG